MQTQEIGQYIIETPTSAGTMQENNTGDKQEDDQDNTNYERMKQSEEFELDTAIHPTTTDDAYIQSDKPGMGKIPPTDGTIL